MSSYNEAVKRILADVNKFLSVTLKSESLSKAAQKEKARVLEHLQDLFTKYDSLATWHSDDGSASSLKESSFDESRNTTGSEDDGYPDHVPDTTVKALTPDADKCGYLDKKQTEGLFGFGWKKMYCVQHKNIFYFFKKPGDKKQAGAFSLSGYTVQEAPQNVKDASKKDCSFELVCAGKKSYQFCADNVTDFEAWRDVIAKGRDSQDELDDDEELYEPLQEANSQEPTSPKAETKPPPPPPPSTNNNDIEEEILDEDDLIYEAVEADKPQPPPITRPLPAKPLPPLPPNEDFPPPPPPHQAVPLPPLPNSEEEHDLPLPPLPSRETGDAPPALPKRNPVLLIPAIPEKKKQTPTLGKLVHPSEDFENMFYGLYSCSGSSDNELNFQPGDIIHVINRELDAKDWWIGELAGKIGLVPKAFLHPAYEIEL